MVEVVLKVEVENDTHRDWLNRLATDWQTKGNLDRFTFRGKWMYALIKIEEQGNNGNT